MYMVTNRSSKETTTTCPNKWWLSVYFILTIEARRCMLFIHRCLETSFIHHMRRRFTPVYEWRTFSLFDCWNKINIKSSLSHVVRASLEKRLVIDARTKGMSFWSRKICPLESEKISFANLAQGEFVWNRTSIH